MGSGEFLAWTAEAERYALGATARRGPVAILATASAPEGDRVFEAWGTMGVAHFEGLGLKARLVQLKTRNDASRSDLIDTIEDASMVFLSGGNPAYLARTLDGTPFLNALTKVLAGGAVFAGCSAGAMVAGARAARPVGPAYRYVGLGLIPQVRFGVHWNRMPGFLPKESIVSGGDRWTASSGSMKARRSLATERAGGSSGSGVSRCADSVGTPSTAPERSSAWPSPSLVLAEEAVSATAEAAQRPWWR